MVTVGIVKELNFISVMLRTPVDVILTSQVSDPIHIKINNNMVDIEYHDQHIWHETIEGDASFFGVESCDTVSRIIACINNDSDWSQYRWTETP